MFSLRREREWSTSATQCSKANLLGVRWPGTALLRRPAHQVVFFDKAVLAALQGRKLAEFFLLQGETGKLNRNPVGTKHRQMNMPHSTTENLFLYNLSSKTVLMCMLVMSALTTQAQQTPWPQFRGPESNPVGTHPRLAERWSKTENVEWAQDIPGRGWSSPIVSGGRST